MLNEMKPALGYDKPHISFKNGSWTLRRFPYTELVWWGSYDRLPRDMLRYAPSTH